MRLFLSLVVMIALGMPAFGEDVPYAERTPSSSDSGSSTQSSSLGELMQLVQFCHIKLWYAGQAQNKELSLHLLDEMEQSFVNIAMLYENIPVKHVLALKQPISDLRRALNDQNPTEFMKGYSNLTLACNECHQAANVGYVLIKKPVASPFSDQTFGNVDPVTR